ncbi:hypothetical protein [Hamadaea tsunoensis]|uniref:hypothetical protein n=1 Tax=Hamadaea tsunoensis TaxID=53368 RepID=UPI00040C4672|nr:hypothetical protein [Hamadaea tsunoensis]
MPSIVLVLLIPFYLVGLAFFLAPVGPSRLAWLSTPDSTDEDRWRLRAYLVARRRMCTAGVMAAGTASIVASVGQQRLSFSFVQLLIGWLAGAIAVEVWYRRDLRSDERVPLPYWWRFLPWAVGAAAAVSTVVAGRIRSAATDPSAITGWGLAAVAAVLVVILATWFVAGRTPRGLSGVRWRYVTVESVRGLTVAGCALALVCLVPMWLAAVPGPYEEPPTGGWAWLALAAFLFPLILPLPPVRLVLRIVAGVTAFVLVLGVPLAWAWPTRAAQDPPFTAEQLRPVAHLRVVTGDGLPGALTDLGLLDVWPSRVDAFGADTETFIGRIDIARALPPGDYLELLVIDRRTGRVAPIQDGDGGGWFGNWSTVLADRYPWLSELRPRTSVSGGMVDNAEGVSLGRRDGSGPLWFSSGPFGRPGTYAADQLELVLVYVRSDEYIYWATRVPVSS